MSRSKPPQKQFDQIYYENADESDCLGQAEVPDNSSGEEASPVHRKMNQTQKTKFSKQLAQSQTEMRSKPARTVKLHALVSHQRDQPVDAVEDHYDIDEVVEKMLQKKDRRIPGPVYKPHSEEVTLIHSAALNQPKV